MGYTLTPTPTPTPAYGSSALRPTGVAPGFTYFETDSKWTVQWDGSAWRYLTLACDTGWQFPVFLNNWVNYDTAGGSFRRAQYRKDSLGYLHVEGLVANGTVNAPIFQLLPAYRPSGGGVTSSQDATQAHGRIDVDANGYVYHRSGTVTYVSLNFHMYVG